jgi:hypothetical protein
MRMDAATDNTCAAYPQTCFLPDLAYRRVSGIFSGFDLARDERPCGLAIITPGDQDTDRAGNDGCDDRSGLGRTSRGRLGIPVWDTRGTAEQLVLLEGIHGEHQRGNRLGSGNLCPD